MIELLLLVVLSTGADVITVDDDGPADFATIVDAIAAAAPGDIVVVSSGSYAGFVLDKDLTLFGPTSGPRPLVTSLVQVVAIDRFTLAGLDLRSLEVDGVALQGVIDDCSVGLLLDQQATAGLQITHCTQVLVSRCDLDGYDPMQWGTNGGRAVWVEDSGVTFVNCTLTGGPGTDGDIGEGGGGGGTGLSLYGTQSRAFIVTTDIHGGAGSVGGFFYADGPPGPGLFNSAAQAILRAAGDHEVAGGKTGGVSGDVGKAIIADGGTVVVSGMLYDPAGVATQGFGSVKLAAVAEPFLDLPRASSPEPSTHVLLYGQAGLSGFLLMALQPGSLKLKKLEFPFWLETSGVELIPVATAGMDQPLDFVFHVPVQPELLGSVVLVQAVFPGLPSTLAPKKKVVTNPVALVVRF